MPATHASGEARQRTHGHRERQHAGRLIEMSWNRGGPSMPSVDSAPEPPTPENAPRPTPAAASTAISVNNCRRICRFVAPSACARQAPAVAASTHQQQVADVHARNEQKESDDAGQ